MQTNNIRNWQRTSHQQSPKLTIRSWKEFSWTIERFNSVQNQKVKNWPESWYRLVDRVINIWLYSVRSSHQRSLRKIIDMRDTNNWTSIIRFTKGNNRLLWHWSQCSISQTILNNWFFESLHKSFDASTQKLHIWKLPIVKSASKWWKIDWTPQRKIERIKRKFTQFKRLISSNNGSNEIRIHE